MELCIVGLCFEPAAAGYVACERHFAELGLIAAQSLQLATHEPSAVPGEDLIEHAIRTLEHRRLNQ